MSADRIEAELARIEAPLKAATPALAAYAKFVAASTAPPPAPPSENLPHAEYVRAEFEYEAIRRRHEDAAEESWHAFEMALRYDALYSKSDPYTLPLADIRRLVAALRAVLAVDHGYEAGNGLSEGYEACCFDDVRNAVAEAMEPKFNAA